MGDCSRYLGPSSLASGKAMLELRDDLVDIRQHSIENHLFENLTHDVEEGKVSERSRIGIVFFCFVDKDIVSYLPSFGKISLRETPVVDAYEVGFCCSTQVLNMIDY